MQLSCIMKWRMIKKVIKFSTHNKSGNMEGFTLIEIILVIVIMGIMATAVAARYIDFAKSIHATACNSNQITLETAQCIYYVEKALVDEGEYADNLESLRTYLKNEELPECPGGGSYILLDQGCVTCSLPEH